MKKMALSVYCSVLPPIPNPNSNSLQIPPIPNHKFSSCTFANNKTHNWRRRGLSVVNRSENDSDQSTSKEDEEDSTGVKAALSMLRFYKREISPLMPNSCRYVPTCSEYSMIAYKKYGVVKGTVLTAWRLCRCNPLGGSGFDPPRWFGEKTTLDE
ncbi:UPF0161 protein At3g09310 isoform X1 [Rhododendron vialii]|uniref:UPF0161 protein At3g09310 isoform X1 n=1 Tax=Rhododendron vialii TaxID=182163 RepID=UPI00265EAD0F|nr:UPF0161 protein At3g09310 isoform X1 [Rhododendron vialii]